MRYFIFALSVFLFSFASFAQKAPVSVSVKTASYTIPAGKYARVIVNLEGNATFTIGGTLALRGTQNNVLGGSNVGVVGTRQLATGNAAGAGDAFIAVSDQKVIAAELVLPAGTVINGTGTWRAIVELYER